MIVRRITAGAAAVALGATAFAAAPAMAKQKQNTTTLSLNTTLVAALGAAGIAPSAISPGKFVGTSISFPAKLKGKKITHKGGLKLTLGTNFVTIENISINYKSGKASIEVNNSLTNTKIPLTNALVFSGGKNKIKKKGTWTDATVKLAKSVNITNPPLGPQDPANLIGQVLGLPVNSIPSQAELGKANIKVKVKK
jgi:hypothetical protein